MKNIIRAIHYVIITYFCLVPFLENRRLYMLIYLIFCCFLSLHWITNNNTCLLTQLENHYYGDSNISREKGFLNNLINPIFEINDKHIYTILFIFFSIVLNKYLNIISYNYIYFINDCKILILKKYLHHMSNN
jgi:hypothetical protein